MIYAAAYVAAVIGFLFVWSRALPRAENHSREIDAFCRRRAMGDQPALPLLFHEADNAR